MVSAGRGENKVSGQSCVYAHTSQGKSLFAAGFFLSLACGHQCNCSSEGAQRRSCPRITANGEEREREDEPLSFFQIP